MVSRGVIERVKRELRVDEGVRSRPYLDSLGNWTVGVGHLLPSNMTREQVQSMHLSDAEIDALLEKDLQDAVRGAESFGWFLTLDEVRQAAIVNLVFNLGRNGFAKFVKTIGAIQNREYQKAGRMLLQSKWATQVGPRRSGRLARMLETGRDEDAA